MRKKTNFIDEAQIYVEGGKGGNGCISFLREKYRPHGGPDGGNGGEGGNVVMVADNQKHTLLDIKIKRTFRAGRGKHGQGKNKTGKNGKDIIIKVPCGTVVYDRDTGEIVGDLTEDKQWLVVARGGKGGRGNASFACATDRAPRQTEPAEPGESRWLYMELKLLADIGLIGLPNAGKSSLISKISAAKPKIASYPFTTLIPHLGVIYYEEHKALIIADIPGLIEGAHRGQGLGDRFLRHVERTNVLLHLVDVATPFHGDPLTDYKVVESELKAYGNKLDAKSRIVAFNKIDCDTIETDLEKLESFLKEQKIPVFRISALTGQGLQPLFKEIYNVYQKESDPN